MLWLPWSWIAHVQTDSTDEMGRSLCQLLNNMMVSLSTVRNVFFWTITKINQFNHAVRINNNIQQHHITTNLRYVIYQKAGKKKFNIPTISRISTTISRIPRRHSSSISTQTVAQQLRKLWVSIPFAISRGDGQGLNIMGIQENLGWILRKDVQDVRSSVDIILFSTFPIWKVIGYLEPG